MLFSILPSEYLKFFTSGNIGLQGRSGMMIRNWKLIRAIFIVGWTLIFLIGLENASKSSWAQSYSRLRLDADRVPWTNLFYQTKNLMVDVSVDVALESLSANAVKAALIESRQGVGIQIPENGAYKLTNNIIIDSIFQPPVKIDNQVWFDPIDATALGRVRLRRGEDDFKKICRFTSQGVFRHRKEPKDQTETPEDPEKWTDVRDTFYAYNLDQLGCVNVSERLLLIYIVSADDQLMNNKPQTLCMFAKRQLFQIMLKPAGLQKIEADYIEKKQPAQNRRKNEVEALKIMLESRPLKSDLDEVENFSFLGFHRDIVLFVDPASRLPLQISGVIPKAGRITVKLQEVGLK
jgi:hypothetical protein